MAKGDSIRVVLRTGDSTTTHDISAEQNGRRVEHGFTKESGITWLEVRELTRGGTIVQQALFSVSEVLSITKKAREA